MESKKAEAARREIARVRRRSAVVLSTLAVVSVIAALQGLWPVPLVDAWTTQWLGVVSLWARIVGAFVIYGLFVLGGLLVALVIRRVIGGGALTPSLRRASASARSCSIP